MKTFLLTTLAVLSLSTFVNAAEANRVVSEERAWSDQMRMVRSGAATLTPVDLSKDTLPAAVRNELAVIAEDQAQIWGDTILEGDYVAEEAVKLEGVELVQVNSAFVGYRVTYSSIAFETSDCNPDSDVNSCTAGRIVESSFVAASLRSWVRDRNALAEFVADAH